MVLPKERSKVTSQTLLQRLFVISILLLPHELTAPKKESPCSNGNHLLFTLGKWCKATCDHLSRGTCSVCRNGNSTVTATESNISAPGYSSHGQNKSSDRYNFKTTAHPSFTLLMALAETWPKMADVINRVQVHLRVTLLPVNCCSIFSLVCVRILQDLIWPKKLFLPIWFRTANPQLLPFSGLCPPLRVWASSALDKWFECLAEHYQQHILNPAGTHGGLARFAREADRRATIQTLKSIF